MCRFALLISAAPLALTVASAHAQDTAVTRASLLKPVIRRDIVVTGYRASLSTA